MQLATLMHVADKELPMSLYLQVAPGKGGRYNFVTGKFDSIPVSTSPDHIGTIGDFVNTKVYSEVLKHYELITFVVQASANIKSLSAEYAAETPKIVIISIERPSDYKYQKGKKHRSHSK